MNSAFEQQAKYAIDWDKVPVEARPFVLEALRRTIKRSFRDGAVSVLDILFPYADWEGEGESPFRGRAEELVKSMLKKELGDE